MEQREHQIKYISLAEAAKLCQHSQEYLSLRARQKKLKAVKSGRNWVTTKEWLAEYLEKVSLKEHKKEEFVCADLAIVPEVPYQPVSDRVMRFRAAAMGLPRRIAAAFAEAAAMLLAMTSAVKGSLISLRNAKKKFHLLLENLKSFQYEFADVARLVVVFILIGSAILFIAKPGVEIAKEQGQKLTEKGYQDAKTCFRYLVYRTPKILSEFTGQARLSAIKVADLGGQAISDAQSGLSRTSSGIQNSAKDIIAAYKVGFKTIASAYGNAPENIAIKWTKVEQNNESIKIALRSNARTSVAAAGRIWQSVQHLTFNDIAYGAENLMARSGKKTFALLVKAGAGYQKLENKYNEEKAQIKESIVSVRLAYKDRKTQTKTAFNFIKSHPEVVFEKTRSTIGYLDLETKFPRWKLSFIKGAEHFAANYKIGLRVIGDSYNNGPKNIAMGWRKLEERNEGVKIGLRGGIVRGGLALMKGTQKVFTDGSRNLVVSAAKPLFWITHRTSSSSQNIYFRTQKVLSELTGQVRLSAIKVADLGGQVNSGVRNMYSKASFGVRNSAFAFARFADAFGRGAEEIYSGIRSVYRTIASKLVGTYEFAIEIFRSAQKPEEIAVKEPQQQIKETASEQKQGMVVVPSTDKDEETKKKIKDSFSDEVKVEIQDDSSGIITPVFRDKEGDKYLYMMVPISEQN